MCFPNTYITHVATANNLDGSVGIVKRSRAGRMKNQVPIVDNCKKLFSFPTLGDLLCRLPSPYTMSARV